MEQVLREVLREILGELKELRTDVREVKADVRQLKDNVALLQTDMVQVKADVALLQTDTSQVKSDVKQLRNRSDIFEPNQLTLLQEQREMRLENQTRDRLLFSELTELKDKLKFVNRRVADVEFETIGKQHAYSVTPE